MEFQNRVLTEDGRALIAQAISSNQRIVFVRAMSSTTYMDVPALVALRPGDLTGPMGSIKTTSATNNVARIMTEFINQMVSVKVRTVAITARLASQADAAAIVIMAQSDPTAGIYIPSTAELSASIHIAFNLVIDTNDEVLVNLAANVSLGDHERLMERTVTTHADGDPTAGEAQTIYGAKTFIDNVNVNSDFWVGGPANFAGVATVQGVLYAEGAVGITGNVQCDADLRVDGELNVDSGAANIATIYTNEIYSENDYISIKAFDSDYAQIMLNGANSNTFAAIGVYDSSDLEYAALVINKQGEMYLETEHTLTTKLGTSSIPFDESHATTTYTNSILPQTSGGMVGVTTLYPYQNNANLGTSNLRFGCVYSNALDTWELVPTDSTSHIGKANNRFPFIYADKLDGVIPHPETSGEPPVGSMTLLSITSSSQNAFSINIGQLLQSGTGGLSVKVASYQDNIIQVGTLSTSGKYRALVPAYANASALPFTFVLAIRVE